MLIFKNKKFRTVIITKKYILFIICIIILSLLFLLQKSLYIKSEIKTRKTLSSNDFYSTILSSQLNNDTGKSFYEKLSEKLLGIDIKKPETMLINYHNYVDIDYEYNPLDTVYPKPIQKNETEKTELIKAKIQEISQAKGLSVSNATNIKIDVNKMLSSKLSYNLEKNKTQILIVHTHTTESYADSNVSKYTNSDSNRSTDEEKNIIAIGKVLKETLEKNGISAIHDATIHDYPSYNGAYNRSKATILNNLKKHPEIKLVLDIHRDGITKADGTKVKVASDINGKKVAQCMFVVGSNVSLQHDNWQENMKLALKLQNIANTRYPGLMRPINLREERFNQQLSKGALIIEVGSNGNTLSEAKDGIKLLGEVISEFFNNT